MTINYQIFSDIDFTKVLALYDAVGWSEYTKNPEQLKLALENSLSIISAWDDDQLVGLIRAIGDNATILYIQDLLVLPTYQGYHIGTQLLNKMTSAYPEVRQKVLLTEKSSPAYQFYQDAGFKTDSELGLVAFYRAY